MRWPAFITLASVAILAASGCIFGSGEAPGIGEDEPGVKAARGDLSCKADTECLTGEACTDGICQIKRCVEASAYRAAPPLGRSSYFMYARDLVAASTGTVDSFTPKGGGFISARGGSLIPPNAVTDVAGGNLVGTRPDVIAVASAGSSTVQVYGAKPVSLKVGFVPIAIAAGDVDGDGVDELVAAAGNGDFAICQATKGTCTKHSLGSAGVLDVAVGDVDADGFAEPVFLVGDSVVIYNADAPTTKQPATVKQALGHTLTRITTGDLDGDDIDEIVGTEDGGMWFWNHDNVYAYSFKNNKLTQLAAKEMPRGTRDVTTVQAGDAQARIAVLGAANAVELVALSGEALTTFYQSTITGGDAMRLSTADVDGDSPTARLKGEAKLVPGPTAPIAVIAVPPYSQRYSSGVGKAMLGTEETEGDTESTSVSLSLTATISAEFNLFGVVKAGINAHIASTAAKTKSFSRTLTVGQAFILPADPERNGYDAGGVVLGCGCYMQFDYDVADPKHALGADADGKTMSVLVPVGGQTTLWSTRRYNALAAALKTIPRVQMPYKIGDVDSYPTSAVTLAGKPVKGEDMLYPNPPSFRVSDVADVMSVLSEEKIKANSTASTLAYGGGGSLGVGATVSGDVTKAVTSSYEVRTGRWTSFRGIVPALRNDPNTPEDEYALNAYSFTPYVYREHYKLDGEDAGLFVLMFAVGR